MLSESETKDDDDSNSSMSDDSLQDLMEVFTEICDSSDEESDISTSLDVIQQPAIKIEDDISIKLETRQNYRGSYECKLCSQSLHGIGGLRKHLIRVHNLSNEELEEVIGHPMFPCEVCFESFIHKQGLSNHRKRIHGLETMDKGLIRHQLKNEPLVTSMEPLKAENNDEEEPKLSFDDFLVKLDPELDIKEIEEPVEKSMSSLKKNNHGPAECKLCKKLLSDFGALRSHLTKRHKLSAEELEEAMGQQILQCEVCFKYVLNLQGLSSHRRRVHGLGPQAGVRPTVTKSDQASRKQVGETLKAYHQSSMIKQVLQKDDDVLKYGCELCDRKYNTRPRLLLHQTTHYSERNYICHICSDKFWTEKLLQDHLFEHDMKRTMKCRFKCDICNSRYPAIDLLEAHMVSYHVIGPIDSPYRCEVCGERFPLPLFLKRHKKTHHPTETFTCATCGYVTKFKFKMNQHERVHTGEKPFSCQICHKKFRWSGVLQKHLKVHERKLGTVLNKSVKYKLNRA